MTSLRFRLTLTYLAVILVGMGLAALLAWLSVERLYVDAQKANLLAQAQLVATALQVTPQQSPTMVEPYAQTANVLPGIHTRVIEELNLQNVLVVNNSFSSINALSKVIFYIMRSWLLLKD